MGIPGANARCSDSCPCAMDTKNHVVIACVLKLPLAPDFVAAVCFLSPSLISHVHAFVWECICQGLSSCDCNYQKTLLAGQANNEQLLQLRAWARSNLITSTGLDWLIFFFFIFFLIFFPTVYFLFFITLDKLDGGTVLCPEQHCHPHRTPVSTYWCV